MNESTPIRLLDRDEVRRRVGGDGSPIGVTTLYKAIRDGRLPRPIHPTPNVARWIESEVDDAILRAKTERDKAA